ncbi:MAG: hypothetical protein QXJ32_05860 [Thermoplasmata archaeon]
MVTLVQIVSAAAGFGPSIVLLYFTLRDYTTPKVSLPFFDDTKIFKFFALGVVLGMAIYAFEEWGRTVSGDVLIAAVLLFAIMESLLKLIILNFPRFQRRVDTAFCGVALGLGMACTFTFASVYVSLLSVENPGMAEMTIFSLIGVQLVLLHGSTTTMIGIGVVRGEVRDYFFLAFLVHLSYSLLMIPFFQLGAPWNYMGVGAASMAVVYAYVRVVRTSLPALIADAKRLSQKKRKR